MRSVAMVVLLAACNGNRPENPPKLLDTGWFSTGTNPIDPQNCPDKYVTWAPENGATGWYWRDRPKFFTGSANPGAYTAFLQTADGERVDTQMAWDTGAGLSFELQWDGQLAANTDYVLGFADCAVYREATFRTSDLGAPLLSHPSNLQGNTYLLDLVGATWVEPPQLAALMSLYFTTPILLGVSYADTQRIDMLGAPGITDAFGIVTQDRYSPTWDFPLATFTDAPYLDVSVNQVVLSYDIGEQLDIPVNNFVLRATFAADGRRLGGGILSGLGDSRNLGALFNDPDNPSALCNLAAGIGVRCEPCNDGQPYCLSLVAKDLDGSLLPNVVLVERD